MVGLFDRIIDIHWRVQLSDDAPELAQKIFKDTYDPAILIKYGSTELSATSELALFYAFNHRYYASLLATDKEQAADFLSDLVLTEPVFKVMDALLRYFKINVSDLCKAELLIPKELEECIKFQYIPDNQDLDSYLEADEFTLVTKYKNTAYTIIQREDVINRVKSANTWFDLIKGLVFENSKPHFGGKKFLLELPKPTVYVTHPTVAGYVAGKYTSFSVANLPTLCDENS